MSDFLKNKVEVILKRIRKMYGQVAFICSNSNVWVSWGNMLVCKIYYRLGNVRIEVDIDSYQYNVCTHLLDENKIFQLENYDSYRNSGKYSFFVNEENLNEVIIELLLNDGANGNFSGNNAFVNDVVFYKEDEIYDRVNDILLKEMLLPRNILFVFFRAGFESLSEIVLQPDLVFLSTSGCSRSDLDTINRIRRFCIVSSRSEILTADFRNTYIKERLDNNSYLSSAGLNKDRYRDYSDEVLLYVERIINSFSHIFKNLDISTNRKELCDSVQRLLNEGYSFDSFNSDNMRDLFSLKPFYRLVAECIASSAPEKIYEAISIQEIANELGLSFHEYSTCIEKAVEYLSSKKKIRIVNERICKYKCSLSEWLDTLDSMHRDLLVSYFNGVTFDSIGARYQISGERMRLIYIGVMKKRPVLTEEDYLYFFSNYNFSKNQFSKLLALNVLQTDYLYTVSQRGTKGINDFIKDSNVPEFMKNGARKESSKRYISVDGVNVLLKKHTIIKHILLKNYLVSDCSVRTLYKKYRSFLSVHRLVNDDELTFETIQDFKDIVESIPYSITNSKNLIRYYDSSSLDINELLNSVNIKNYDGRELSTWVIYHDAISIMVKYDIRDPFELHNIIKIKSNDINIIKLQILTAPNIRVGSLKKALKPQRDGIGVVHPHNVEVKQQLSTKLVNSIKSVMKKEMYLWEELEILFSENNICVSSKEISPKSFNELGYRVYSNCVIKDKFATEEEYFRILLTQSNRIDLASVNQRIKLIPAFYNELYKLCEEFELIEISKDVFITYAVFKKTYLDVSKDDLRELSSTLLSEIDKTYFPLAFIKTSHLDTKYVHLFNNCWIFASVLRMIPGVKTSCVSGMHIVSINSVKPTLKVLIEDYLYSLGECKISELGHYFSECYGITNLNRRKIMSAVSKIDGVSYYSHSDKIILEKK